MSAAAAAASASPGCCRSSRSRPRCRRRDSAPGWRPGSRMRGCSGAPGRRTRPSTPCTGWRRFPWRAPRRAQWCPPATARWRAARARCSAPPSRWVPEAQAARADPSSASANRPGLRQCFAGGSAGAVDAVSAAAAVRIGVGAGQVGEERRPRTVVPGDVVCGEQQHQLVGTHPHGRDPQRRILGQVERPPKLVVAPALPA